MSDNDVTKIMITLRQIQWQQARAALIGLLHTFWEKRNEYDEFTKIIDPFIKKMDEAME